MEILWDLNESKWWFAWPELIMRKNNLDACFTWSNYIPLGGWIWPTEKGFTINSSGDMTKTGVNQVGALPTTGNMLFFFTWQLMCQPFLVICWWYAAVGSPEAEKPAEKFEVMRKLERAGRTARPDFVDYVDLVTSLVQLLGGNWGLTWKPGVFWMLMGQMLDAGFFHSTCMVNHYT